jgi:perosamine synthetase
VRQVLEGFILTHGPRCKAFEGEFAAFLGEEAHCITVSSCMAALHLACLQLGIGPGDEVIVPAQTHTATVHAVEWVGATPVFVDADPLTGNVKPQGIREHVTERTKAIAVVHFLGIPCEMGEIAEVARAHDLQVIEDCALALGARINEKHVGLFGDAGCFSFYPAKHITTGEGGMFVSRHQGIAESVARIRAFGVDRSHTERAMPGMYDVPALGLNYRMSELQAALGCSQLRRFSYNLGARRENFELLRDALAEAKSLRILDVDKPGFKSSHYCLSIVLQGRLAERRNEIVLQLNRAGIGTSVYYPHPVPRMAYYRRKYGYIAGAFPAASEISDHSIALPVGPHIGTEQVLYMAEQLKRIVEDTRQ